MLRLSIQFKAKKCHKAALSGKLLASPPMSLSYNKFTKRTKKLISEIIQRRYPQCCKLGLNKDYLKLQYKQSFHNQRLIKNNIVKNAPLQMLIKNNSLSNSQSRVCSSNGLRTNIENSMEHMRYSLSHVRLPEMSITSYYKKLQNIRSIESSHKVIRVNKNLKKILKKETKNVAVETD